MLLVCRACRRRHRLPPRTLPRWRVHLLRHEVLDGDSVFLAGQEANLRGTAAVPPAPQHAAPQQQQGHNGSGSGSGNGSVGAGEGNGAAAGGPAARGGDWRESYFLAVPSDRLVQAVRRCVGPPRHRQEGLGVLDWIDHHRLATTEWDKGWLVAREAAAVGCSGGRYSTVCCAVCGMPWHCALRTCSLMGCWPFNGSMAASTLRSLVLPQSDDRRAQRMLQADAVLSQAVWSSPSAVGPATGPPAFRPSCCLRAQLVPTSRPSYLSACCPPTVAAARGRCTCLPARPSWLDDVGGGGPFGRDEASRDPDAAVKVGMGARTGPAVAAAAALPLRFYIIGQPWWLTCPLPAAFWILPGSPRGLAVQRVTGGARSQWPALVHTSDIAVF